MEVEPSAASEPEEAAPVLSELPVEKDDVDKGQPLVVKLPIFFDDKEVNSIRGAIREYRYVARRAAAMWACLDIAGANMAVNDAGFLTAGAKVTAAADAVRLKAMAELAFSNKRYNPLDGAIVDLAPHWPVEQVQLCAREVLSRWRGKDPDTGRPLKYLLREGERVPTRFNHAALPILFAKSSHRNIELGDHSLTIRVCGKVYTAKFGKLDGYQHRIVRGIIRFMTWEAARKKAKKNEPKAATDVEEECQGIVPGGAKLKLTDDGFIYLLLGYYKKPAKKRENGTRVLEVGFNIADPEAFFEASLVEGHRHNEGVPLDAVRTLKLSAVACVDALDRLKVQSEKLKKVREGRIYYDEATRHALEVRGERLQEKRSNVIKDYCHNWTDRIARFIEKTDCSKIVVRNRPTTLLEREFQWSTFKFDLEYKSKLIGIEVVYEGEPEPESKTKPKPKP
jgi:hypothetical protein